MSSEAYNIPNDIAAMLPADKPTFSRAEVAAISGLTQQRLAILAMEKRGPAYLKLGRSVRYPRAAVIRWLCQSLIQPKGEAWNS